MLTMVKTRIDELAVIKEPIFNGQTPKNKNSIGYGIQRQYNK
jgi:hypothetical protein